MKFRVVDGDTIHINKTKYRLHGIDAPEINQQCKVNGKSYACGLQSKKFLESLAQGKEIICKQKDIDRYKRIVAVCFADNLNLNQEMVKSGWAVAYRYFSKDYIDDEKFAENNKLIKLSLIYDVVSLSTKLTKLKPFVFKTSSDISNILCPIFFFL